MGLPPLEYSDCFLDSPSFREIIALYEQELEGNTRVVKNLVKECDNMIQKTEGELYFLVIHWDYMSLCNVEMNINVQHL